MELVSVEVDADPYGLLLADCRRLGDPPFAARKRFPPEKEDDPCRVIWMLRLGKRLETVSRWLASFYSREQLGGVGGSAQYISHRVMVQVRQSAIDVHAFVDVRLVLALPGFDVYDGDSSV